jgi:hypothetical protein
VVKTIRAVDKGAVHLTRLLSRLYLTALTTWALRVRVINSALTARFEALSAWLGYETSHRLGRFDDCSTLFFPKSSEFLGDRPSRSMRHTTIVSPFWA